MTKSGLEHDVGLVCDLIERNRREGGRTIIGIAGPPASGKSTLAEAVVLRMNKGVEGNVAQASLLPMDGLLSNSAPNTAPIPRATISA